MPGDSFDDSDGEHGEKAGRDAKAIARVARAWSTGNGWTDAVGAKGLTLVAADGASVTLGLDALAKIREQPPGFATENCSEATVNTIFGEPLLEAYFGIDAKIQPWPSDNAAWSAYRCFGLVPANEGPAVRVCVVDDEDRVRAAVVQVGLTERPTAQVALAHPDLALSKEPQTVPTARSDAGPGEYNVVRIAKHTTLPAYRQADLKSAVIHRFVADARSIPATGANKKDEASAWIQLTTPAGPGWVERRFVARVISKDDMTKDDRYRQAMTELLHALVDKPSSSAVPRELDIMHYDEPLRWSSIENARALSMSRKWAGPACESCIEGTVRDVIGGALTDVLHDVNAVTAVGELRSGPNSSWLIPVEFSGFNLISIYDPHDTDCSGYDWMSAAFFFDEQDGAPALVAVGFGAWSP
ncbi:MAG: hypothetical protein AAF449_03830 [Myxococcota bacterium]